MTPELADFSEQQLTRIRESGVLAEFEGASPELRESLARVVTASDFICRGLARESSLAHWLVNEAAIQTSLAPGAMAQRLRAALAQAPIWPGSWRPCAAIATAR